MEEYPIIPSTRDIINNAINQAAILSRSKACPNESVENMDSQILGLPMQSNRYMNQRDKLFMYQLNQYYMSKASTRKAAIAKTIQEVIKIVQDVLRELEIQEPRFISTFTETNGHYEGLYSSYRPSFNSLNGNKSLFNIN